MGLKRYGAMIAAARIKAGLSQEQLGDAIGVTRAAVSSAELGRHAVFNTPPRLEALKKALPSVDTDELMRVLNADEPGDPPPVDRRRLRSQRVPSRHDILARRYGADAAKTIIEGQAANDDTAYAKLMELAKELDPSDVEALFEAALIMKSPASERTPLRYVAAADGVL